MRLVPVVDSHKSDTFLVKVSGDSLQEMGICDGDLLLVERVEGFAPRNPLVVRSGAAGLVIERANGDNGCHGVVTEIVRRCFQARLNGIESVASERR